MESLRPSEARRAELEKLFLESLGDIERIVHAVSLRCRLSQSEEDEFAGEVRLAFVENDYQILDRFRGLSSLRTYLTTVVHRLLLDRRRRQWGKWRPSAAALRHGSLAIRLEELLFKDGLSLDESIETLRTTMAPKESREELVALAQALPRRLSRRSQGDTPLESLPALESANPEVQFQDALMARRVQATLSGLISSLSPQDHLVLRLRFEDQVSVADIARLLRLEQKPLYRRINGILAKLRESFQVLGLSWSDVEQMIDRGQCEFSFPKQSEETEAVGPSQMEAKS